MLVEEREPFSKVLFLEPRSLKRRLRCRVNSILFTKEGLRRFFVVATVARRWKTAFLSKVATREFIEINPSLASVATFFEQDRLKRWRIFVAHSAKWQLTADRAACFVPDVFVARDVDWIDVVGRYVNQFVSQAQFDFLIGHDF